MELPPPWEIRDSTRYPGRCFYYNPDTQESSWLRPSPYPGSKPSKWPPIIYVLHILILNSETAEDTIRSIAKDIISGKAKFEDIAKEKSEDAQTREQGGIIGWIKYEDTPEEFRNIAWKLRPGEMSPPVPSSDGFHLILRRG